MPPGGLILETEALCHETAGKTRRPGRLRSPKGTHPVKSKISQAEGTAADRFHRPLYYLIRHLFVVTATSMYTTVLQVWTECKIS